MDLAERIQITKLGNAINFLLAETKFCQKTKLFKLLFYLDFVKFKVVGKPFFGLEYKAWEFGPVPDKLFFDFTNFKESPLAAYFKIVPQVNEYSGKTEYRFFPNAKSPVDLSVFSRNDQKLLKQMAEIFRDAKASEMVETTHFANDPWDKTLKSKGLKAPIEYTEAIDGFGDGISVEEAMEALAIRLSSSKG